MAPQNHSTIPAPFPRTLTATNASRRTTTTTSITAATTTTTAPRAPQPPRSINERFDRMFYTSPLPRSISREYNNLRATTAGATTAPTSSTTPSTTTTVKPKPKTTAATTTTIPSSLRHETSRGTPKAALPARAPIPRSRPTRATAYIPLTGTTTPTDSEDLLSALGASSIASPPPLRPDVDMNQNQQQSGDSTEEEPLPQLTRKRTRSPTRTPVQPTKARRTTAAAGTTSAGRSMRSAGRKAVGAVVEVELKVKGTPVEKRRTELAVAALSPAAKKAPVLSPPPPPPPPPPPEESEPQLEDETEPEQVEPTPKPKQTTTPKPKRKPQPQPKNSTPATTQSQKTKKTPKILPGFVVPAGILDSTGSAWSGGRRLSRRHTLPTTSFSLSSPAPITASALSAKKQRIQPKPKSKGPRKAVLTRPVKAPRRGTTSASIDDTPVPAGTTGNRGSARDRRVLDTSATEEDKDKDKEVQEKKRHTSTFGLNQLRKARELRSKSAAGAGNETEEEEKRMDRVMSAGIEGRTSWVVEETPQVPRKEIGLRGKAGKETPQTATRTGQKGRALPVTETPMPTTRAGKQTPVAGKDVGMGRRVTRGSTSKKKGTTNPEWEFSDEE